jgi:hypothetical protein
LGWGSPTSEKRRLSKEGKVAGTGNGGSRRAQRGVDRKKKEAGRRRCEWAAAHDRWLPRGASQYRRFKRHTGPPHWSSPEPPASPAATRSETAEDHRLDRAALAQFDIYWETSVCMNRDRYLLGNMTQFSSHGPLFSPSSKFEKEKIK